MVSSCSCLLKNRDGFLIKRTPGKVRYLDQLLRPAAHEERFIHIKNLDYVYMFVYYVITEASALPKGTKGGPGIQDP
jgi:hypothetical protein